MNKYRCLTRMLILIMVLLCFFICIDTLQVSAKEEIKTTPDLTFTASRLLPQTSYRSKAANNVKIDKECYTGETFKLSAVIIPANAYVGRVNWTVDTEASTGKIEILSSSDISCTVKPTKAGKVIIKATAADGQGTFTTYTLNILQYVTNITLSETYKLLEPNETFTFTATLYPEDASNKKVIWSSSNESIATVNENGTVTAHKASLDSVTITCTAADGGGAFATAKTDLIVLYKL